MLRGQGGSILFEDFYMAGRPLRRIRNNPDTLHWITQMGDTWVDTAKGSYILTEWKGRPYLEVTIYGPWDKWNGDDYVGPTGMIGPFKSEDEAKAFAEALHAAPTR
jgi:hypothetical protein